jgi:hypothetical protein
MIYTLRYSSLRSEVWRWYWKEWKTRLWRIHVFIATFFCIGLVGIGHKSADPVIWANYFFDTMLIITIISSAIPQILFKSQERTLNIGPEGWDTQIGKKKCARGWNEVASIREEFGKVIITNKNGNAFIVPERAFLTTEDRERFTNDIMQWHASYKSANN